MSTLRQKWLALWAKSRPAVTWFAEYQGLDDDGDQLEEWRSLQLGTPGEAIASIEALEAPATAAGEALELVAKYRDGVGSDIYFTWCRAHPTTQYSAPVCRILFAAGCGCGHTIDYPDGPLTGKQRAALLDGLAKAGAMVRTVDAVYEIHVEPYPPDSRPVQRTIAYRNSRELYPIDADEQLLKAVSELCREGA